MNVRSVSMGVPPATASAEIHTDWLELTALGDSDRRASIEDLVGGLRTSSTTEDVDDDRPIDRGSEQAQAIAESAMSLAEERSHAVAAPRHYPFDFIGQTLTAKRAAASSTYAFLLAMSWFGDKAGPTGVNGASLFEEVAAAAAHNYFGGDKTGAQVYSFGFPRTRTPAKFGPAIKELCALFHEGVGPKGRPTSKHQKDAKLDLVTWIPMPDDKSGKLVAFGQCATGNDWKSKVSELQAGPWCKKWLVEPLPVDPIRLFFVPHRIDLDHWHHHSLDAGVVFDRCRITAFASVLNRDVRQRVSAWTTFVLRERVTGK